MLAGRKWFCSLVLSGVAVAARPAWADLEAAHRLLRQSCPVEALREVRRSRAQEPERARLLEVWSLQQNLQEDQAKSLLAQLHPKPSDMRLFLLVSAVVSASKVEKVANLEKALELSQGPNQKAEALCLLYRANSYPRDQKYLDELNLHPGCLVTVSSCSSGVGQRGVGRDLLSLAAGFRTAGASSVIGALWPVDDEATSRLFPAMYQGLRDGLPRAQSLRQAKIQMIRQPQYTHPFYWSAFTLLGDPR